MILISYSNKNIYAKHFLFYFLSQSY